MLKLVKYLILIVPQLIIGIALIFAVIDYRRKSRYRGVRVKRDKNSIYY